MSNATFTSCTTKSEQSDTLVALLSKRVAKHAGRIAYTFLVDGESERQDITYGELHAAACSIAAALQDSARRGDRVLLLFPGNLDFISSFLGCLYAGAIAVPVYPPNLGRFDGKLSRFQGILKDCQPTHILTTSSLRERFRSDRGMGWEHLRWIEIDKIGPELAGQWQQPGVNEQTIAFLQYTSGSTASPKGVMVSHGNILHNEWMIKEKCSHTHESTFAGWLPLYHDMGLIGNVLQPLYLGARSILMSPSAFLQHPIRWLRAISNFKAVTSGGPNFAYDLCVYKTTAEQREGLDLSSWRVAFNGAEPIRSTTIDRFTKTFTPYGFKKSSFFPCYGLAEATLIVSGQNDPQLARDEVVQDSHPKPEASTGRICVGSGTPVINTMIAIVDPDTLQQCPPGTAGEVWVQSPSVALGYWEKPELTAATFRASLPGVLGSFLRTGDLGFLTNGQLVINGRLKDLIIIRGQNYHPEEIEFTVAQSCPSLLGCPGAAFSIELDGAEELIVVQGINHAAHGSAGEVAEAVRRAIAEQHGLHVHTVLLVDSEAIPRTSSGKVQRHVCRVAFLANVLSAHGTGILQEKKAPLSFESMAACVSGFDEKRLLLESIVHQEFARLIKIKPTLIDPRKALTAWGLDSIMAAELEERLLQRTNVAVPASTLLTGISLEDVVRLLLQLAMTPFTNHDDAPPSPAKKGGERCFPLSSEQERLWYLQGISHDRSVYNVAVAFPLEGVLDVDLLERGLATIVERHELLRAIIVSRRAKAFFVVGDSSLPPLEQYNLKDCPPEDRDRMVRFYALEEAKRPFDLERGPMMRCKLLCFGTSNHVLLVIAHRIIIDAESFRILFDELATFYESFALGKPSGLLEIPFQAGDFAQWQNDTLNEDAMGLHISYWRRELAQLPGTLRFPAKEPSSQGVNLGQCELKIPEETFAALLNLGREQSATVFMVLLAAWNTLLSQLTGSDDFLVGIPVLGRPRTEFKKLIGCFAFPVLMRATVAPGMTFRELLVKTRESVLKTYQHLDLPFSKILNLARRSWSDRPLKLQAILSLIKDPEPQLVAGLKFAQPRLLRSTLDVDLSLTLVESQSVLRGILCYNPAAIAAPTAELITCSFSSLLKMVTKTPNVLMKELYVASEELVTAA